MGKCHHCKKSLSRSSSLWTCFKCNAVYHEKCVSWQLSPGKKWVRCCVWTLPSDLADAKNKANETNIKNLRQEKKNTDPTDTKQIQDNNSKVKEENGSNVCFENDVSKQNDLKENTGLEDGIDILPNTQDSTVECTEQYDNSESIENKIENTTPLEYSNVTMGNKDSLEIKKESYNVMPLAYCNNADSYKEKGVQVTASLCDASTNTDHDQKYYCIFESICKGKMNKDGLKPITTRKELIFELNKIEEELMETAKLLIEDSLEKYYNMANLFKVSFDIKGALAPVFTPVDEKGAVNFSILPEYITFLHTNGIQGILVGGTTGESITLSLEERKAILEAWLRVARPLGVMVIMQVGGVPMPDVIKMAEYAEELKADAIMSLPELYYKPKSAEQLVDYLHAVSSAAPSLPLLYYHFPMMTGVDFNMSEFFKLASSRIPNFKGMKADLGVALQVADNLGEDQRIFIGNHLLAPAVLLGHDSSIATVTNMFPRLVRSIVDAVKAGEVDKAKALQEKLNSLVTAIASQGEFLPAMKAAMPMVTGIEVGPPRRPNVSISDQKKNQLMENLTMLDFGRIN